MKDVTDPQIQAVPVPLVVPDNGEKPASTNQFDPKFLEAVELVLQEDDELLKRLAS